MAFLKKNFTQDLTSDALDFTMESVYDMRVIQVTIKASTNITETITITLDQKEGSDYDITVKESTLNSKRNYLLSDKYVYLTKEDKLRIQCTNANTTGTVYGTVVMEVANVR